MEMWADGYAYGIGTCVLLTLIILYVWVITQGSNAKTKREIEDLTETKSVRSVIWEKRVDKFDDEDFRNMQAGP